jgi:hypothetical protein
MTDIKSIDSGKDEPAATVAQFAATEFDAIPECARTSKAHRTENLKRLCDSLYRRRDLCGDCHQTSKPW